MNPLLRCSCVAFVGLSSATLTAVPAFAQSECLPPDCDIMVVTGKKLPLMDINISVMNIFYAGGISGGGSGSFIMETASLDDISPEYTPVVVPLRHRLDLDGNGTVDVEYGENFVVYGVDDDGDARPDTWDRLLYTGRAWPF